MTTAKSILPKLPPSNRLKLLRTTAALILTTLMLVFATEVAAQVFTTLVNFNGTNGASATFTTLVQGVDGDFYGTTTGGGRPTDICRGMGGEKGCGTVYKVTPQGALSTLYRFCSQPNCIDGAAPRDRLVLATDGNFYGITDAGGVGPCTTWSGTIGCGTVFSITKTGRLTTLYRFCPDGYPCADGSTPSMLLQGIDGNFYGISSGGPTCLFEGDYGCGTVFKITPAGTLTTIYTFCSQPNCADGSYPRSLIQASDGNFYGTTSYFFYNVAPYFGTVFRMTPQGKLTTLYRFCSQPDCTDGDEASSLIQATDGNFYGTTPNGGIYRDCNGRGGCGSFFKLTPEGALTTLYSFCAQSNCTDGIFPQTALIQATDGKFYGTTMASGGEGEGWGTIFNITVPGTLTTLHAFCSQGWPCPDGTLPSALLQATNGTFYGTTGGGGGNKDGTVFNLSMGLDPFVTFVRSWGKVEWAAGILGEGFSGTIGVSFNGTPAPFKVRSDNLLTATVPVGATTGPVTVTTPSGTLTSNVPFRVTPQLLSFDPPSGPVGTVVTITGVSLTQTQGVGFGDYVPASFTVNSDTQVTATIPAGAQTGRVGIQTLGGITKSSGTFTVTP